MHTTYSDGRDTLRRMIDASHALRLRIHRDHRSLGALRRLADADARRSRAAARRDRRAPRRDSPGLTILHGIEVDILPDGSLDCPDAVLESLDIVLASLHDSAGQDGAELTRRCLGAIRHPLVNVITHPANQLVGRRPGYDMDYAAIYEAAAETGTALEIDGAPSHLDLSGERAREAVAGRCHRGHRQRLPPVPCARSADATWAWGRPAGAGSSRARS